MKSNIAIFVLAIIVGLTGCARHEQSLTGGITIAVPQWYAPEKVASLAHVIADWNATHPQAAVSCKVLPGKRDALLQKILLAAQRGELADAVLVRNEWLGRLAAEGLIDPLPDALAATVRRSALPSLLLAIGDGQRIWATPFDAGRLAAPRSGRRARSQVD